MLIAYHPLFFGVPLAGQWPDLHDVTFEAAGTPQALAALAPRADAMVLSGGVFTAELAAALRAENSRVRWLQFTTAGTETAARFGVPDGVRISNASPVWAPGVAEHAVALLLASLRRVPEFELAKAAGRWDHAALVPQLAYLDGARVGLLGLGEIGRGIAARLRPFGAGVVGFARSPRVVAGVDEVRLLSDLEALVPELDALVSSLPATRETRGLVGEAVFARMKPGCVFVNVGRGQTVDEAALIAHLTAGRIRAALDVFAVEPLPAGHAIWTAPNLIVSPHLAALGGRAGQARLLALCHDNISRFRSGAPLLHQVVLEPV